MDSFLISNLGSRYRVSFQQQQAAMLDIFPRYSGISPVYFRAPQYTWISGGEALGHLLGGTPGFLGYPGESRDTTAFAGELRCIPG
jgi:hypothetical protein